MSGSSPLGVLSCILIVVGALNWGLVGLGTLVGGADWNVVHMLLGAWPSVEAIVYVLVGLAGVLHLFKCKGACAK